MAKENNTHGGARKGAGRKPKDDAKQPKTYKLSIDVIEFLASTDNATETIETTLRNSKAFKLWKKSQA